MEKTYRGDLMGQGVQFAFGLVFIGILVGAGAIALSSFATSATKASGTALENQSVSVINNGTQSLGNLSGQLPVVGTIAGVGLIIIVLFVALGTYMARK